MPYSHKPLFIAITGGIACGKTLASTFFKNKGYDVYSADTIGHDLLKDKKVSEILEKTFGKISKNGVIDRQKLADIVFNDDKQLKKLNEILHPLIEKEIRKLKTHSKSDIVFFEIPLLFEVGKQDEYDYVICICCNKDIQIQRLKLRNSLTDEEALKRIEKQLPVSEKKNSSHFIIENNNGLEDYLLKLESVLKKIKERQNEKDNISTNNPD